MTDPRLQQLSDLLINYSTNLKPGENLLIEAFDIPDSLVQNLIRTTKKVKANPYLWIKQNRLLRELIIYGSEVQLQLIGKMELEWMKKNGRLHRYSWRS